MRGPELYKFYKSLVSRPVHLSFYLLLLFGRSVRFVISLRSLKQIARLAVMRSDILTIALCILAAPEYVTALPRSLLLSKRGMISVERIAHPMGRRNQPVEIQQSSHNAATTGEEKLGAAAGEKEKNQRAAASDEPTAGEKKKKQGAATGGEVAAGEDGAVKSLSQYIPSCSYPSLTSPDEIAIESKFDAAVAVQGVSNLSPSSTSYTHTNRVTSSKTSFSHPASSADSNSSSSLKPQTPSP
jgi:hypothetical protein